jgi:hypothetical protein
LFVTRRKVVQKLVLLLNAVVLGVAKIAESAPELPAFRRYLSKRLAISCIVLAYTFYEPFTSTMLLILQCQRVAGPVSAIQKGYNDTHTYWLYNSNNSSNAVLQGLWGKPAPVWEDGLYW